MSLRADDIRAELRREEKELAEIHETVKRMKENIVDKTPDYFSIRDIINAFFGSIIIGFTFILKGATKETAIGLSIYHIIAIISFTFIVLASEIYFIGYLRVKEKRVRHFGQFLAKRLVTIYSIAIITTFILIFLFNINSHLGTNENLLKMVFLLSLPCSVGAAIPNLLRQY